MVECIFRKKKRVTSKPPGFTVILCQSFSGGSLFSNHGWKWFLGLRQIELKDLNRALVASKNLGEPNLGGHPTCK